MGQRLIISVETMGEPNLEYVATDALVAELESRGYKVGV